MPRSQKLFWPVAVFAQFGLMNLGIYIGAIWLWRSYKGKKHA